MTMKERRGKKEDGKTGRRERRGEAGLFFFISKFNKLKNLPSFPSFQTPRCGLLTISSLTQGKVIVLHDCTRLVFREWLHIDGKPRE